MTQSVRIGTRGSPLALAQARLVRAALAAAHGWSEDAIEIVTIRTSGDRIQDRPLSEAGGKGLFTKEIEEALLGGAIELAVHSAKDMPTVLPEGLMLAACLPREDVRDAFISRKAASLRELPQGAVVGTASLRRQAQVRRLRPDLSTVVLRGNVETRLRKLDAGEVDATLLALAGLRRLGLAGEATALLDVDEFLPAVGQGAVTHRGAHRRCRDARTAGEDRSCGHQRGARLRARVSGRARRLVPHADRRPRDAAGRRAGFPRHDFAAGRQRGVRGQPQRQPRRCGRARR